jgi:hypothetical protein
MALLCMLGESIVIVPKNLSSLDFKIDTVCNDLRKIGYQTIITEVSKLS